MLLHEEGEVLLVWFNRLREEIEVRLPAEDKLSFETVLVSAIDTHVSIDGQTMRIPPRSVVVLAHTNGKS
jgi:glycogen operon protein